MVWGVTIQILTLLSLLLILQTAVNFSMTDQIISMAGRLNGSWMKVATVLMV